MNTANTDTTDLTQNSATDWNGSEAAGETAAASAPAGPEAAPAKTDVAAQDSTKPRMPAHSDEPHTKTPQPEYTHNSELPQHATLVAQPKSVAPSRFVLPVPPPTDLKEAFAFLEKLNGLVPTSQAEYEERQIAVRLFGQHVHKIQQGSPVVDMVNPTLTSDLVRHNGRAALRQNIIAKGSEFLAAEKTQFTAVKIATKNPLLIRAIVASETDEKNHVKGLLHVLRQVIVEYAIAFYEKWPLIYPDERAAEIRIAMAAAHTLTADQAAALNAELLNCEHSAAEIVSDTENTKVLEAHNAVKAVQSALFVNLIEVLKQHRDDAIRAEKIFFDRFELPREQTGVSKQYDGLISTLEKTASRVNQPHTHPSRAHPIHPSNIDEPFGMEILPGTSI